MIWSPKDYDAASVLAREAGEEMLSRLDWMTIKPNVIVDMGCGTGAMSARLQMRYKGARVLALDLSDAMLHYAKQNNPIRGAPSEEAQEEASKFSDKQASCDRAVSPLKACGDKLTARSENLLASSCASSEGDPDSPTENIYICADAAILPLSDGTVDLIFANFLLPWYTDFSLLLREWQRVLRPDGLLMLTALGPDTLQQCRQIFHSSDLPCCVDMHEIGDELLQAGFADPVLDVSHYTMVYRDKEKLMAELHSSGMLARPSAQLYANDIAAAEDGTWPISYEVIHAHAFVPEENAGASVSSDGTVRIPLTKLRQQLK